MRRLIIIELILITLPFSLCYGQPVIGDSLLFYEYKYFKSENDTVRQQLLIKKINLYLNAGISDRQTFLEIKRVKINYLDSTQIDFLWNASLVSYLNDENDYASFFLSEYLKLSHDTSITAGILEILVYKYTNKGITDKAINRIKLKDSLFDCLHCFEKMVNYKKKHLNAYLISSAIIPGSGSALNGYFLKGLCSLALISASAFAIVKMVEYGLYVNAALWGSGVGLKFYLGNINLTEKLFYRSEAKTNSKLAKDCEMHLKNILKKHPLNLKLK